MRYLLGTTALAVAIATASLAQSTPPAAPGGDASDRVVATSLAYLARGEARDVHVSELIGRTLYAADADEATIASRDDWESVGAVNDVLLTREGEVRAILVDVGAFLGMGGKTIAAPLGAVRYVTESADAGDYFLVITANRDTLQGAPAYERPENRAKETAMNNAIPTAPAIGISSIFAYDGYDRTENTALTARDLEKAVVYGHGDNRIGVVSELIMSTEGKITDAVIDVGGFLGMGARSVSMPFAELTVLRKTGGDDVRVYLDATKAQLEAMPRYNG